MIELLKKRYFAAGVQAELKAQFPNQNFVQRVCLSDGQRGAFDARLGKWRDRTAIIKPDKVRFFVATCGVLGDRLVNEDLSPDDLEICAKLLSDRCSRIFGSPELLAICKGSLAAWMAEVKRYGLHES